MFEIIVDVLDFLGTILSAISWKKILVDEIGWKKNKI